MKVHPSECESVAEIMKRVSHADLLRHYLGIDSLPALISSPLRNDDAHPSFFIYSPDGTKVLYKDYATGDKGDIYSLLMAKKGVTFSSLMREIAANKAFSKKNGDFTNQPSQGSHFTHTATDIKVKIRTMT